MSPHDGSLPLMRYTELAKLSDDALMAHLQAGHYDALAVLFDRYHRLVINIAMRILRDTGEAEDLMQSVFLEIFRSAAQFDPAKGTTKVWVLQYAYHRSFNRRHYLSLRGLYDEPEERRDVALSPHNLRSFTPMESSRLVEKALEVLNPAQREILELAFFEGMTMHEIAKKTGDSFDSVRHNYYRGLEKLRSLLCERPESSLQSGQQVPHAEP